MKFAIIEPSKTKSEHLSFNQAVINELAKQASGGILLYCSGSHYNRLEVDIPYVKIPVVSIVSRQFISKLFVESYSLLYSLSSIKNRGVRQAIILSIFPPLLSLLPILSKLFGISITLIIHGELDGVVDASKQHISSYGYWMRRFINRLGYKKIRCIILGKGIHSRFSQIFPEAALSFEWANHPIVRPYNKDVMTRDIAIASTGIATARKHSVLFQAFLQTYRRDGIKATHIGMTEPGLFEKFSGEICFTAKPGEHLSMEQYHNALKITAVVVFPYDQFSYRLGVSGAMLDALSCGCRVVSLENPFARDLQRDGFPVDILPNIEALSTASSTLPTYFNLNQDPFDNYSASAFVSKLIIRH